MRAVLWQDHLPMRQVCPRLFVRRKNWVAPPRRREYHWHPSGNWRSVSRVFSRSLIIPGETDRRKSPGCNFVRKLFKARASHGSSMIIDSCAPRRCPLLVKGKDQTTRRPVSPKTKFCFTAAKSSPVRANRSKPTSSRIATSSQPNSKARCAKA